MSDATIEIREGAVWFIESRCELTNPVALRDMPEGMLYDGLCAGEGETWSERMLVYRTYDGVAVLSRGAARTYSRCE